MLSKMPRTTTVSVNNDDAATITTNTAAEKQLKPGIKAFTTKDSAAVSKSSRRRVGSSLDFALLKEKLLASQRHTHATQAIRSQKVSPVRKIELSNPAVVSVDAVPRNSSVKASVVT